MIESCRLAVRELTGLSLEFTHASSAIPGIMYTVKTARFKSRNWTENIRILRLLESRDFNRHHYTEKGFVFGSNLAIIGILQLRI